MKKIKYTILDRSQIRKIFYSGTITGGLLWAVSFWLFKNVEYNSLLEGLSYVGAIILGSTIAFCAGMLFKVDENSK